MELGVEDDDDAGEALGHDLDEQRSEDEEEQDDEMQSFIVPDDEVAEEGVSAAQDQVLQHLLSNTEVSLFTIACIQTQATENVQLPRHSSCDFDSKIGSSDSSVFTICIACS